MREILERNKLKTCAKIKLTFKSDHDLIKDNSIDWATSGSRFAKPEWTPGGDNHPVSQTKDTEIVLDVKAQPGPADGAAQALRREVNERCTAQTSVKWIIAFCCSSFAITDAFSHGQGFGAGSIWRASDIGEAVSDVGSTAKLTVCHANVGGDSDKNFLHHAVERNGGVIEIKGGDEIKYLLAKCNC